MDKRDVLIVVTLGGFTMWWNGKTIAGGVKARDSQFTRLMQILLHRGEWGVERHQLQKLLFADSASEDYHHMLRSVIYNARRKLREVGLPDVNYIEYRKGSYYWTKEIPVFEDARHFEKLCRDAIRETDTEKKLEIYKEAYSWYRGDFLPHQTNLTWVVNEEAHYQRLFKESVEESMKLLRETEDFVQMEKLGRYATKVHPLQDWERITMEALVSMNRYEEARRFYEETIDYYMLELGVRPSFDMMQMLDDLAGQMEFRYALLDEVQRQLSEYDKDVGRGAYMCTYPVFQGIYRMLERMLERQGLSICLMLCSIMDSRGQPMKEGATLTKLSLRLEDSICKTVRHGDVVCRYGKGQYLILLINTTQKNCDLIKKRIDADFRTGRQRTGIKYNVGDVAEFPRWAETEPAEGHRGKTETILDEEKEPVKVDQLRKS